MKRGKQQRTRAWQPMQRGPINPAYIEGHYGGVLPPHIARVEAWENDVYQATVEHHVDGGSYVSFKRHDRVAAHDWRHIQAIKNELCGPEREGFELYPAESRLMDTSNQYHLWVLPLGERLPVGQDHREVATPQDIHALNAKHGGKARQRAWQPGLPTGPNIDEGGRA